MIEHAFDRESDVDTDEQVANSRAVGGDPAATGTGESGEFAGRVAGDDAIDVGATGAEARRR